MLRSALALATLCLLGTSVANDKMLTIGDTAPTFKVEGWAKGTPVKELKAGNVYVVEFWATWCGPCIAAMPHLTEVAKKYKDKATIISINTWDYAKNGDDKESGGTHVERVNNWVKENDAKMGYNVAFDDVNDFMSTTWMRAAGRNGIPCAFIVNEKQQIAWIGHPMQMDEPLEKIVNKTWDLEGFKKEFQVQQAKALEAQQNQQKVVAAAKAANVEEFEALMAKMSGPQALSTAISVNPEFALAMIEKHMDTVKGATPDMWCSFMGAIAQRSKNADTKAKAVKISEACVAKVEPKMAALGAIYHARTLFYAGEKEKAIEWADKAAGLVDAFEPENQRASIKKYIEDTKTSFSASK